DVDADEAAADRAREGVEADDRQHRDGAQAIDVRPVFMGMRSAAVQGERPSAGELYDTFESERDSMKPTVLIVDDEPGVRTSLSGVLRDEGYAVEAVPSGEACLERLTRGAVALIVLNVWLTDMDR